MTDGRFAGLIILTLTVAAVLWLRARGGERFMTWPLRGLVGGLIVVGVALLIGF